MKLHLTLCTSLMILAGTANAHDAWIGATAPHEIMYGHPGKLEGFDASKVKSVISIDANGKKSATPVHLLDGKLVAFPAKDASLLVMNFQNGFFSKTKDGYKPLPKTQVPDAIETSFSVKQGKTVFNWSKVVAQPIGARIEIVPLSTTAPKAGDNLPVQVLLDGKPLPDAKLRVNAKSEEDKPVVADAQGKAKLKIDAGENVIGVYHKIPYNAPEADIWGLTANVHFVAK